MRNLSTMQSTFFLLISFSLLVLLNSFIAPIRLRLNPITSPVVDDPLRILVGVISISDRVEVRHLIRLVNSLQPPIPDATIDVMFVFCRLTRDEQRVYVGLEMLRHDDIIMVDCARENMDNGKTYLFFSSVARRFHRTGDGRPPYDYVMKTDDDTYLRFPELVTSLRPLPREDLYYGHTYLPRNNPTDKRPIFMCGMGYVLSWDLVEWIAESEITRNDTVGHEDEVVGRWLRGGNRGGNVYDTRPSDSQISELFHGGSRVFDHRLVQYDLPNPPLRLVPNTISVHRLKDRAKWATALSYFNVTAGVRLRFTGSCSSSYSSSSSSSSSSYV